MSTGWFAQITHFLKTIYPSGQLGKSELWNNENLWPLCLTDISWPLLVLSYIDIPLFRRENLSRKNISLSTVTYVDGKAPELNCFFRFLITIFGAKLLHAVHCVIPVSSTEQDPVVEPVVSVFDQHCPGEFWNWLQQRKGRIDLQLIKFHSILVLVLRACLRYQPMVLTEKAGRKSAEHPHEPQFILGVSITTARIERDVLYASFTADPASGFVAAP